MAPPDPPALAAAAAPAETPELARREPTLSSDEAMLAEPAPTVEEPVLTELAPTVEEPVLGELPPTVEEPVLREAPPTVEQPAASEAPPTVEQPAAGEAVPTAAEPAHREPAPTQAGPVVVQAAAPEPEQDAGTAASPLGEETDRRQATAADAAAARAAEGEPAGVTGDTEPQGGPADPDATRETAIAAGHEPAPTWPAPALVQSLERGPVDSGLVAPPREFWRPDGEDEPRGHDDPRPPEIDQDAPTFATAPFATVPRLNRVRATPVPPEDGDE
jgi:ribonuclease E